MKFLYLAKNNIEAEIIKDKLLQLNIKSFFIGSNLHMAIGELPLDALYVKIFVDEDEYQDANKVSLILDLGNTRSIGLLLERDNSNNAKHISNKRLEEQIKTIF